MSGETREQTLADFMVNSFIYYLTAILLIHVFKNLI